MMGDRRVGRRVVELRMEHKVRKCQMKETYDWEVLLPLALPPDLPPVIFAVLFAKNAKSVELAC